MKILYAIFNRTFLLSTHLINLKYFPPRERERETKREREREREKEMEREGE